MSGLRFNPSSQVIILNTILEGKIVLHARLVLDTGASLVVLPWRIARGLGLVINPNKLIQTTTVSTVESSPITKIPKVVVLGKTAKNVTCLIKDLPPEAGVDGLLGLSFLKNFKLSLDFKKGLVILD